MFDWIRFEQPAYLLLLLLIPLIVLLSRRSLAGLGPVRKTVALGFRGLVILIITLALAGMQRVQRNEDLSVVFLLDRSHSVPRALQDSAFEFVRAADAGREADDQLGVVAFDGSATIEQLPTAASESAAGDATALRINAIGDALVPDQTNLAAAIRLGMAMFTGDTMRRLVVLTDGNENVGEVLEEARQFAAAGVPIDVVPLAYRHESEVMFEQLRVPPTAAEDETVNLRMVLRNTGRQPVPGKLNLYQNDQLIESADVTLPPGPSAFDRQRQLFGSGAHRFRAEFVPDDPAADTIASNNSGRGFSVVATKGRALITTTQANYENSQFLQAALQREKIDVDLEIIGGAPLSQTRLLSYGLVILDNVPANLVTQEEQDALTLYVRELGGGVMMLGGNEAFRAGGWIGSPLEEVMPVSFDVKSKKQIPQGALVLVMHSSEVPQGNYIGKRVAIAAAKALSSRDLIGVLRWDFNNDSSKYWTVPLQPAGDKSRIIKLINQLVMHDMPDLHEVMRFGVDELIDCSAAAKHMVVISDFDPSFPTQTPRDVGSQLLRKMRENNISCSTVAIGWGAHQIFTQKAQTITRGAAPGGRFEAAKDFSKLPQFFIKEARLVQRKPFYEGQFTPTIRRTATAVLPSLAATGVPDLHGYVVATPKPLAEMPLVRSTEDGDDPILAYWQAGLGKTVAFTSGMWRQWGPDWTQWPRFSNVWAQLARWATRQGEAAGFDVTTSIEGGKGKVRIEARDVDARALSSLDITGGVVTPDNQAVPLRLTQTGPGRYEGEFDARSVGSYVMNFGYQRQGAEGETSAGSFQAGTSVPYSPEYRELETNRTLLSEIREQTGGRELAMSAAPTAFDRAGLAPAEVRTSIWEDLIRLAIIIFLLDVAIRRIAINPKQIARQARKRVAEMAGEQGKGEASAATLGSLRGVRDRSREEREAEAGPTPSRGARYEPPTSDEQATRALSDALGGADADKPVVAPPSRKPKATEEGDYTSRLLAAKRRARQQQDEENQQKGDS